MALPSHFSPSCFTVAALDNFENPDQNILSGNANVHDTAVIVFQEKSDKPFPKQLKNESPLNNVTTLTKLPANTVQQGKGFEVARII